MDEAFFAKIAYTTRGNLAPLCSFFGGFAAQEAIKAVTHKFTPLNQWVGGLFWRGKGGCLCAHSDLS